jgi:AAA domain (dynein-related subfamily)
VPFPSPDESTTRLDQLVRAVPDPSSTSSSKWSAVTDWLAASLGAPPDQVHVVYVNKSGNMGNRFTQSPGHKRLGLGLMKHHDDVDRSVRYAQQLVVGRYDAIALASAIADGPWTVRVVVQAQPGPVITALGSAFPNALLCDAISAAAPAAPASSLEELADELLVDRAWIERVVWALRDKRGLVLYGPPGTGKTYIAQRIAEYFQPDPALRAVVQFHPTYGYEDFFEGYRPVPSDSGAVALDKFDGPLRLLHRAAEHHRQDAVLVIDEMNRANLPKVFGELFFALEYRRDPVRLMYDPTEPFVLGERIHLIGTMNTADRSIALLDQALRRRFYFVGLFPGDPVVDGIFDRYLARHHPSLRWLVDVVQLANDRIGDPNVAIGPSHFMRPDLTEEIVARVWQLAVLPTIEEHFFDDRRRAQEFQLDALRAAARAWAAPDEL